MLNQLIEWYQSKHPEFLHSNTPSSSSLDQLRYLSSDILEPIAQRFGEVYITYGFTSHPLLLYILKHNPQHMAPTLDQHASMEKNSRGKRICHRDGASCDFLVRGYESDMGPIAKYICEHLKFDRLYFYGQANPIHISIGPDNTRYALIRQTRSDGKRVNTKSATGNAASTLFDDL